MKPSVQIKLEEMNQKLSAEFIAENIKREPAAWERVWTEQEVADATIEGDNSTCYFAIYTGKKCGDDVKGGVYRISEEWCVRATTLSPLTLSFLFFD